MADSINEIKSNVDLLNGLTSSTVDAMEVFDDAMKGLKSLSKAGAVLGVFGSALDITTTFIDMATGEPSPEEKIMGMIDDVANQISGLGDRIDDAFSTAELKTELAIVNARYGKEENSRTTLITEINDYRESQSKLRNALDSGASQEKIATLTGAVATDEDKLYKWWNADDGKAYHETVTALASLITDKKHPELGNRSLLELLYELRFGDLKNIMAVGAIIFEDIVQMSVAFGVIRGIQKKRDAGFDYQSTVDDDGDFFSKKLTAVSDAIETYMEKCKQEAPANINKKTEEVLDNLGADPNQGDIATYGYAKSSSALQKALSAHFSWLRFSVVIYDPVAGNLDHQYRGTYSTYRSGQLPKFRYRKKGKNWSEVNLFIYWADRKQPSILANNGLGEGFVDWLYTAIDNAVKKNGNWPIDLNTIFANQSSDPHRIGFDSFMNLYKDANPEFKNVNLNSLTWWLVWAGHPRVGASSNVYRYQKYGDHVFTGSGTVLTFSKWDPDTTYYMIVFD